MVSFYKFDINSDIANEIDKEHRRICEILNVPYSLWSFFTLKSKYIKDTYKAFEYVVADKRKSDDDLVKSHDYSKFEGINLTFDEMFFIFHNDEILKRQEEYNCVNYSTPSLRDLSMRKVALNDPRLTVFLPKSVNFDLSEKYDHRMPTYDAIGMREKFFDKSHSLYDRFRKIDQIHSKEFVVWFQNENLLHEMLNLNMRLIFFHYFHYIHFHICMNCMQFYLESNEISGEFFRIYIDITHKYMNRNFNIFSFIQNPLNWCNVCRRVPLFLFMSEEEFKKEYDEPILEYLLKREKYI